MLTVKRLFFRGTVGRRRVKNVCIVCPEKNSYFTPNPLLHQSLKKSNVSALSYLHQSLGITNVSALTYLNHVTSAMPFVQDQSVVVSCGDSQDASPGLLLTFSPLFFPRWAQAETLSARIFYRDPIRENFDQITAVNQGGTKTITATKAQEEEDKYNLTETRWSFTALHPSEYGNFFWQVTREDERRGWCGSQLLHAVFERGRFCLPSLAPT